jgi:hypothetical protein
MPVILSGKGKVITGHDLGPFEVGADLEVICQVAGGKKQLNYQVEEKKISSQAHRQLVTYCSL